MILFNVLFAVKFLVYFVIVAVANEGTNIRRVVHFVIVVAALASMMSSHVVFVIIDMLVYSAHVTSAAVTLFLLHSGGGPGYQSLEYSPKDEPELIEIEDASDCASSSDDEEVTQRNRDFPSQNNL
jgi:hypothetical protein